MTKIQVDMPSGMEVPGTIKSYEPVGYCIYCRHQKVRLYPEHIIPFGIAGNALVLPAASCKSCGDKTGKIENYILRHAWWPFRTKIGAPTYKPKERPKDFTLRKVRRLPSGSFEPLETIQVKTDEYPTHLVSLRLMPPGIIENRPATSSLEGEIWSAYSNNLNLADQEGIYLAPLNPQIFCQMLAKIAHAYAFAEFRESFTPMLLKLIKGKSATPNYWVGGDWVVPPPTPGMLHQVGHQIAYTRGRRFIIVGLRLFAFFGTPQFRIVAGELH